MLRKGFALFSLLAILLILTDWIVGYWMPIISFYKYDLIPGPCCINVTIYWDSKLYNDETEQGWRWQEFRGPSLKGHVVDAFSFMTRREGAFTAYLIPLGPPLILFALVFWFSFIPLYRRHHRTKCGLCLKCGYDLRASRERCPECGTPFKMQT